MGPSMPSMMGSQELISQWCWREANWSMERKRKIKTIDSHFLHSIYKPQKVCPGFGRLKATEILRGSQCPDQLCFFLAITEDFPKHGEVVLSDWKKIFPERAGCVRDSEAVGAILMSYCLGQKRGEWGEWAGCTLISTYAQKHGPIPSTSSFLSLSLLPLLFSSFLLGFFPPSFLTFLKRLLLFCFCGTC